MNSSDTDWSSVASRALQDSAALAPPVPQDLSQTVERRGRRSRTLRTASAWGAAGLAAVTAAVALTGGWGSTRNPSTPAAPVSRNMPVTLAAVDQVRQGRQPCPEGWLAGYDACFHLAADSIRLDHPDVELATEPGDAEPVVRLKLEDRDSTRLAELTGRLAQRHGFLAVIVDGRVVWAPEVQGKISGGSMEISTTEPGGVTRLYEQIR